MYYLTLSPIYNQSVILTKELVLMFPDNRLLGRRRPALVLIHCLHQLLAFVREALLVTC